jgi:hypothetical protein
MSFTSRYDRVKVQIKDATGTLLEVGTIVDGEFLKRTGSTIVSAAAGGGGVSDGDKGDITVSGGGATWTIDATAVTFAKIQNIATDRLLGRDTAASGSPEEISLNATLEFTGATAIQRAALTGDVTASAGSNATTLAAGSASVLNSGTLPAGRMPALTGDVTTIVGTVATTIANDVVTYGKMQNVSAISKLLGRGSAAGVGDVEEITLGTNLSMSGTTLNASGGGSASITATTVTVPYGTRDALIAVTDASVTVASKILLTVGAYLQTLTNDPSDADFSVEDIGTGTFNVRVRAKGRESIGGPFNLNYILG